jgi:hypothetical protein
MQLGMSQWIGIQQSCVEQAYSLIANGDVPDKSQDKMLTKVSANGTCLAQDRSSAT